MKRKWPIGRVLLYLLVAVVIFVSLFPLFWMVVSSFKVEREVMAVPLKIFPTKWVTESYQSLFEDTNYPYWRTFFSTLIVSIVGALGSLTVNTMAAYAFARLQFTGKRLLWSTIISTMYIPGITILLTSFILVNRLGMLDTYAVLIIPGLAGGYSVFFFRQFFLGMPMAIEESAMIDGATRFRIFWQFFIPMAVSPLIIMGVGAFLGYWNSFVWPTMTLTDPNKTQMMQVIRSYRSVYANKQGVIMAASTLAAIPPLAIFFIFQRHIVKGIILSGLK